MANTNLTSAKRAKNDEFYTCLSDIEKELDNYREHFNGKIVYCNCDDARESNFFKFFQMYFEIFGLKKLITTSYNENGHGSVLVYEGDLNGNGILEDNEVKVSELKGNGDFRSEECIEFLKEADIVVTNPPFSLFREYVAQLVEYGKKFLILGNKNAITYKEIFPLIKENKLWLGYGSPVNFRTPNGEITKSVSGLCRWFTNLENKKRNDILPTMAIYSANSYPKYDNYDAIEVSKVADIPEDYNGIMGVPITFLDKYNPSQFEIVGQMANTNITSTNFGYPFINGKKKYARILIKKLH